MCNLTLRYVNNLKAPSQHRGIKFTYTSLPHNGGEEPDSLEAEMVSHWLTSLATPRAALKDNKPLYFALSHTLYFHMYISYLLIKTHFCRELISVFLPEAAV